jgi:hypothetical protein
VRPLAGECLKVDDDCNIKGIGEYLLSGFSDSIGTKQGVFREMRARQNHGRIEAVFS